jgi:hypothetical protein
MPNSDSDKSGNEALEQSEANTRTKDTSADGKLTDALNKPRDYWSALITFIASDVPRYVQKLLMLDPNSLPALEIIVALTMLRQYQYTNDQAA